MWSRATAPSVRKGKVKVYFKEQYGGGMKRLVMSKSMAKPSEKVRQAGKGPLTI